MYFGDQKWFTKTRRDNGKGGVEVQGIKITHKAETREERIGEATSLEHVSWPRGV